jgi:ankyrin repeat protein
MSESPKPNIHARAALMHAIDRDNWIEVEFVLDGAFTITKHDKQKALVRAVVHGHTGTVRKLLERIDKRTISNTKDHDGRTPLLIAVEGGHMYIVSLLIEYGADLNAQDNEGQNSLIRAVNQLCSSSSNSKDHNRLSILEFLLQYDNLDFNHRDRHGRTALWYAAAAGKENVVRSILDLHHHRVVSQQPDNHGRSAWSIAAEQGHRHVVKLFVELSQDEIRKEDHIDNHGRTPLSWAANSIWVNSDATVQCSVVEMLLDLAKDPSSHAGWLLDTDMDGRSPLSYAVENSWSPGDVVQESVYQLLESGKFSLDSRDQEGRTVLSRAAACGLEAVVEQLLSCAEGNWNATDSDGRTPLSVAAAYGRQSLVQMLLDWSQNDDHKLDPNSQDHRLRTPLHHATAYGHEGVVEVLVTCDKVNRNIADKSGQTPLDIAVSRDDVKILKLLMNDRGTLHALAREGNLLYVQCLLRNGCGINKKDVYGRTPLHAAVLSKSTEVVEELLRWKADVNIKDANRMTSLQVAMNNKSKDLVDMLLHHSASTSNLQLKDWFYAYDQKASLCMLVMIEKLTGEKSVQFVPNGSHKLRIKTTTCRQAM